MNKSDVIGVVVAILLLVALFGGIFYSAHYKATERMNIRTGTRRLLQKAMKEQVDELVADESKTYSDAEIDQIADKFWHDNRLGIIGVDPSMKEDIARYFKREYRRRLKELGR